MYETLKETIEKIIDLSSDEMRQLGNAFSAVKIPSRSSLTVIGSIENRLYFVIKGVLRLYCINTKEEETTTFIFSEGNFASCYESFLTGQPSEQGLETLEDCILLVIDKAAFDSLHQSMPKMNLLTRMIADKRFINSQKVFIGHITRSPEERYLDFEQDHGQLLLRVPLNIIASYLGITPVSLSRIRKRTARK
ncbi:Crp/Fnr family transcriptional regulator [Pedobacter sp. AW31-3R]|uniref:Crp/Fnr family transcriptional regulator n=1 Tax=Pedobacter sp. AW31-3R TaxID=3445781 RepID=UPI003FA0D9AD